MSDPLSVLSAVVGLVGVSAHLGRRSKELYDSAKVAPTSMLQLHTEMQNIHIVFVEVEMFVRGTAKKRPTKKGMTMISLHHLMTILTGCVLVFSNIDKKLSEVAGLVDPTTQKPIRNLQSTLDRIKWALWKEAEITVMLQDLDRHKLTLNMMLSLIQCNSTSEANEHLESLRGLVDEISESNLPTSDQLRALISRQHDEPLISCPSTFEDSSDTTSTNFSTDPPSASACSTSFHRAQSDNTSILSTRSIQSLTTALFSSRAYKKLRHHRSASGADSSGVSFFSLESSATKGDRWSMLSDISLGQLSISEIGVLELPICLSDVYDSELYEFAMKMNLDPQAQEQSKGHERKRWSSFGRIHHAIRMNSDFALRTMINVGVDIEEKDSKGRTPLRFAAREGNWEAFRLLLEKGANVNAPDSSGRTLLSHAAANRRWDICQLLIEEGAEVNVTDSSDLTPLSHAAAKQRWDICKLLVEKGAEVNVTDSSGSTALSHAAAEHKWKICKLLVEKGAEVNAPDSSGCTPLSHAAREGNTDMCQLLLNKGAKVDALDSTGRTPLSYTAASGTRQNSLLSICQLLVENGAAVDTPDSSGRAPLSYAASAFNSLDICKLLVEKGVAVDAPDSSGRTPLSYAAASKSEFSPEICELLVAKGAVVEAPDFSGRTPLSYAAANSTNNYSLDTCKVLVDKGAALNQTDSTGHSPYWYACNAPNNDSVCRFLFTKGAK